MDIKCATCQEPWDHYHMLHDEAWEVWDGQEDSSSHLLIKKFLSSGMNSIPDMLREDLKVKGWAFGQTIVCILECPCCASNGAEPDRASDVEDPKDPEDVALRKELRLEAEELLGGDLDGLISTLTTIDMFAEL